MKNNAFPFPNGCGLFWNRRARMRHSTWHLARTDLWRCTASSAFQALGERLAEASPTGKEVRDFGRLFYALAQRVEMDAQGRIRIPQELFQLAELDQEVMMIGVRDKVEIWDTARWERYLGDKQPKYDEIAERAFGN